LIAGHCIDSRPHERTAAAALYNETLQCALVLKRQNIMSVRLKAARNVNQFGRSAGFYAEGDRREILHNPFDERGPCPAEASRKELHPGQTGRG
jgi:hypothetical protein